MRSSVSALFVGCHPSVFGYPSALRDPHDAIAGSPVDGHLGHNVSVSLTAYHKLLAAPHHQAFLPFFHEHRAGILVQYFCFCPIVQPCTPSAHIFPSDTQSEFGTLCKGFHSTIKSTLLQLME